MRKLLAFTFSMLIAAGAAAAPSDQGPETDEKCEEVVTTFKADSTSEILFYFFPRVSMFFYAGNEDAIREASEMIEQHRTEIENGDMFISVNGYSSSFKTEYSNYKMAKSRSSQVKSYFITNLGMKEEYYVTKNFTKAYNGDANVVAMVKLLKKEEVIAQRRAEAEKQAEPVTEQPAETTVEATPAAPVQQPAEPETAVQQTPAAEPATELTPTEQTPAAEPTTEQAPVTEPAVTAETETLQTTTAAETTPAPQPQARKDEYSWESGRWSVKTNIPAWALVVANVAAEYRFADHWSVDVPIYYSSWTTARTYRFRTLAVQPSVRYWLKPEWKGHFFGVHLTAGQFNISVDKNTRYQDVNGMYGVGIDYGYALKFSDHWGMEFNIGAGYIYTRYNSYYNIKNGTRFDTSTKNYWGVTRCGISLIYRIK